MNNYELRKTAVKLILFESNSQSFFISVKNALNILPETEEYFANAMFYVIKDNVTNIISGDLAIQLGLWALHNNRTSKVSSQALSINNIFLDNDSKNKVSGKLLNKYHKVFEGVGKYN